GDLAEARHRDPEVVVVGSTSHIVREPDKVAWSGHLTRLPYELYPMARRPQMDSTSTATAAAATDRKWWTLGAVCVATFMLLLDITVVNTALPAIQRDLGGSFTDLQWVV